MLKANGMRLLVALLLASAAAAANNENSDNICDCECCVKPHPTDCTAYYYCEPGHVAQYYTCSEGLVFHPNVRQCVLQVQYPQCQIGDGDDDECDFTCPSAEGMYAHPLDCNKWVYCSNSKATVKHCPENLQFNAAKQICDWPNNVQCTQQPDATCDLIYVEPEPETPDSEDGSTDSCDFTCPEQEGMYAHPRDCSKFVSCANSQPSTSSCPPNLVFNAAKKVCDWSENVQCTSASDAECVLTIVETVTDAPVTGSGSTDEGNTDDCNFVCPEIEGMYAHPRDCSKFVSCANSEPSTGSCPPNLVFNAAKKVCDWSENVQCTSTSDAECVLTIVETVTDAPVTGSGNTDEGNTDDCNFVCPEVEGMYAHPRDCSKFVSCANSLPSTSSCPPNLVFNAAKKVCDWPENVQCACSPDAECVLTIVETVTDAPVTGSGSTDEGNTDDCNFACPEVEGMYAHPRDCSKFVSCANSQPSTGSCPPNLVFNAAKKVCDWPENVQCTSASDAECVLTIVETVTDAPVTGSGSTDEGNTDDCNFACPEVEGMYAHPRDCSKFVSCANSQPSTSSCPPNLVFNAAKKVCDWSENVQCTSTCDAACVLTIVETVTDAPVTGSEGTVAPTTVAPTTAAPTTAAPTTAAPTTAAPTTAAPTTPAPTTPAPTTPAPTTPAPTTPAPTTPAPTTPAPTTPAPTTPAPTTPAPTTPAPTTPAPTTPATECNFICPENGFYPHPRKCSQYVSCANSVAYVKQCPTGLHYNPVSKNCDWPQDEGCTDDEEASCTLSNPAAPPTLPNPNEQICDCECCLKPHPDDCTSYYYCAPGADAQFHACSDGLVFHPEFKQCVLQTQFPQCQPEVPPTCDPTCECVYPAEVCSEYFKCNREGTPIKHECTGGLLFNDKIHSCDLPQNVECSGTRRKRSLTNDGAPQQYVTAEECKQLEGKFAVEGNPNAYYFCSHGTAHLMRCPDLAVFSFAAQDCIFMK